MKVEHLSLANCGGFEQLDLRFEPDVTLIAGVNGMGKSTILRALAVLFSRALPEFTPSLAQPISFSDDDILGGQPSLTVSARLKLEHQQLSAGVQRIRAGEEAGDRFVLLRQEGTPARTDSLLEALQSRTLTGNLDAGTLETRAALRELRTSSSPALAVYFSVKRQLPGQPRTLPAVKPFEPSMAYGRALQDREVELREVMHWFRTQEVLGKEREPRRLRVLEILRRVITDLIPEFSNLRIQEEPRLGFVVDKRGSSLYLHQLSDGERGLLALVFDLSRRLAIANPLSENPIAEGEALVLIDEIELHLHPKWQRDILSRLTAIFRSCQFVITTHSPLVLGEAEARCVRFLSFDEGKVIVSTPEEAYGLDANRILREFMNAPIRNGKVQAELGELFNLIDDEMFNEARLKSKSLEQFLGPNEPELTRAAALIKFLEGSE